jgi:hypothetical protein
LKKAIGLILAVVFFTACGDLKVSSYLNQPPGKETGRYRAIEIYDFETELPDVPEELLKRLPDEIANTLKSRKTRFQRISREPIEDIPAANTVVLLGEIVDYESGRDIKFEEGAVKFGESSITVQIALVDKESGEEVASGQVNGFSSLGFFRSGIVAKELYKNLAEEIVKLITQNYK